MRLQLALNVRDLDQAVDFYSKLFDAKPAKRKPGYANFSIEQQPLKLVLFELPDEPERLNHLGVEVFEDEATCCYAKQNKVWAQEPDGMRWEWYRVVENAEEFGQVPAEMPAEEVTR